jgi:hypothetical protein
MPYIIKTNFMEFKEFKEFKEFNISICPKLKRSTQQYCQKCMYMCSEYGLEKCPNCKTLFEDSLKNTGRKRIAYKYLKLNKLNE